MSGSDNGTQPNLRARLDERALFNPAFVAAVIGAAADGHQADHKGPLPLTLAFVIPPMALTRRIREVLPRNVRPYLATWLDSNPLVRADLQRLAPMHADSTRQALRFGVRYGLLSLTGVNLQRGPVLDPAQGALDNDAARVTDAGVFLGRWLPRAGSLTTTMTLLGLRP